MGDSPSRGGHLPRDFLPWNSEIRKSLSTDRERDSWEYALEFKNCQYKNSREVMEQIEVYTWYEARLVADLVLTGHP